MLIFIRPVFAQGDYSVMGDAFYQAQLCGMALHNYGQFKARKYWMDHDRRLGNLNEQQRQIWIKQYVMTWKLMEYFSMEYEANCRKLEN